MSQPQHDPQTPYPVAPRRRRGAWALAISVFFIILLASAAGIVITRHLGGAPAVSPVNAETAPTVPLSAGLSPTPPAAAATPANAKVATPAKSTAVAIDSFSHGNEVDCSEAAHQATTISMSWAAANATKVTLSIDGPGVYKAYDATGSDSVPFSCPGPHTYLLTAYGADGRSVSQTATITAA